MATIDQGRVSLRLRNPGNVNAAAAVRSAERRLRAHNDIIEFLDRVGHSMENVIQNLNRWARPAELRDGQPGDVAPLPADQGDDDDLPPPPPPPARAPAALQPLAVQPAAVMHPAAPPPAVMVPAALRPAELPPAARPPDVVVPAVQATAMMAPATVEAGPSGVTRSMLLDLEEPPQPPIELLLLAAGLSEEEIALVRTFEFTCHYFPPYCLRN